MSTHFRPRPPPPPSSPARPSTSHSTIRAVTPSPSNSLPRRKSEPLSSPDLTTFRSYVLQAESAGFTNTPSSHTGAGAVKLHSNRGGIASGRTSPSKSRTRKRGDSVREDDRADLRVHTPTHQDGKGEEEEEDECPDTPTPMTREQKRQAYHPLKAHPTSPTRHNHHSPTYSPPPNHAKSIPLTPNQRISVSGTSNLTALSSASKHSIFSTPGRDEMERKKALVEVDEGPFGRATSMADLDEERRAVSSGEVGKGEDDREGTKGRTRRRRLCGGVRCLVM